MHSTMEFENEKRELQTLLASGIFDRAPNLAQVLTYVCERYFEGASEQIKEYNIAVDALGRRADFDQRRDSIVRVEAYRLRKRLREYYEAEGTAHNVRIEIPPGQYAPTFVRQQREPLGADESAITPVPSPRNRLEPAPELSTSADWSEVQTLSPLPNPVPAAPSRPQVLIPPAPGRNWEIWFAVLLGAAAIFVLTVWKISAARPVKVSAAPVAGISAAPSQSVRILAGLQNGFYTDRYGRVWQSDRFYQGGSVFEFNGRPIIGTRDQRLFLSRREGAFSYDIPLAPGVYELRLYFAETLYGENNMAGGGETSRVFAVSANSQPILQDFDVIREAGASAADIRAFKDISPASDGKLHLRFDAGTNPAIVSAIEITPGTKGKLLPIRLVSRDQAYTDKQGQVWSADGYSRGGQLVMRTKPVSNVEDGDLLRGERYGNLSYVIPVPPGRYSATLYFAEAWFGPGEFAGGGVGSRVFDILCNGVAIRRAFDVYKEARGNNRAVVFPMHGLEPDSQGKITISLIPLRNYASLNALELVDEAK